MFTLKKYLYVSALVAIASGQSAYGMRQVFVDLARRASEQIVNGSIGRGINNAVDAVAREARAMRDSNERDRTRKLAEIAAKRKMLEADINSNNPERRRLAAAELERIAALEHDVQKNAETSNNRWNNIGADATQMGLRAMDTWGTMAVNMLQEEQRSAHKLKEEAVKADQDRQRQVEQTRINAAAQERMLTEKLNYLRDPNNIKYLALGATGVAAGFFAAKHGFALAADYIKHIYRNPELAEETSLLSTSEKITDFLLGQKIVRDKVTDVVLKPELRERIDILAESTKNTVENNTFFRNILFYGPPGTGKTMLAKKIARTSGLHYIYFAASSLDQFTMEEALIKLTELFNFAKKSTRKLMIIIDEVENLFTKRGEVGGKINDKVSEKTKKMLTELLARFGTETKDYLVVGITNRPQDLDSAVLSRFDEQIEIPAPTVAEREKILQKYITDYLKAVPKTDKRKYTLLGQLLDQIRKLVARFSKTRTTPLVSLAPDALNSEILGELVTKTDGFVGRDISKLVLAMQVTALTSKDKTLTVNMVRDALRQKLEQKAKEQAGFKSMLG